MNGRPRQVVLFVPALAALATLLATGCPQTAVVPDGGSTGRRTGTAGSGSTGGIGGTTTGSGTGTTTGGSVTHGGSPCQLDPFGNDPCVPLGYVCVPGDGGNTCQLPVEFGLCASAVGCAKIPGYPLTCAPGFPGGDGGVWALCIERCQSSAGCQDVGMSCQDLGNGKTIADFCFFNGCSDGGPHGAYYGPCNSSTDAGDGQCLPIAGTHDAEFGACIQTGSAGVDQVCGLGRDAGAPLCASGLYCSAYSSPSHAVCLTITGDGGCAAGTSLFDIGSPFFGVCTQLCTGGTSCPSGLTCQVIGTDAFCLP